MPNYNNLVEHLILNKIASSTQLQEIRQNVQRKKGNFVQQLLIDGVVGSNQLSLINHHLYNLPLVNLSEISISAQFAAQFNENVIRKHIALPIYSNAGTLYIATFDPANRNMFDEFGYQGKFSNVEAVVANYEVIEAMIEQYYAGKAGGLDLYFEDEQNTDNLHQALDNMFGGATDDEAPVVKFVTGMLLDAIRTGVSDLHFEPYEAIYRVRFRRDGVLNDVAQPPANIANRITARLKVMASLDIAEKRVPQDGRIKLQVSDSKSIDFRVNSLPTLWGEKIVLRILDSSAANLDISALGFEEDQKRHYLDALHKPQGLILVTGPTGSGKTVSLYTGLSILNQPTVNICTAEDPVEINLMGVNQVNVNNKTGMDFAAALKAFLRQDPDIVMIGEIRDQTTAEIAVKAAQTGHLVLSTLHTNDVPQTIARLINIGVEPYNIAASVNLIMAQRLVRKLCGHCKTRNRKVSYEELLSAGFEESEIDDLKIYVPKGCDRCNQQGYRGRAGVYQVIPISDAISEMILHNASAAEIEDACRKAGYNDLRRSALNKVKQGVTSLSEVLRVTTE